MKKTATRYRSVEHIVASLAKLLRPPKRRTVAECAGKYRYLNNAGAYVGPWLNTKAPYLVEPMNELDSREFEGAVFVGPAQSGKPVWIETPVPTPTGWKRLADVAPGDIVFSEHGEPVRVVLGTEVFQQRDCYRIVFDDNTEIIADGVHRWAVNDQWASDPYAMSVKDTQALFETYRIKTARGGYRYRYSIPVAGALQLPEVDLPIDPYILGLWLGDGHHDGSALTVNHADCDELVERIKARGYVVTGRSPANAAGSAVRLVLQAPDGLSLRTQISRIGLKCNKAIPSQYLRASEGQRRDLLRGLMDTDGTVAHNGRCQFSQSRHELFLQAKELVTSLGIKPMCDELAPKFTYQGVKRDGAKHYRLSFCVEDSTDCFTLNRQIARHRSHLAAKNTRPTHSGRRFVRLIEPVESVPVRCIGVDSASHLFLIGEQMVPTHNTDALILNWITFGVKADPMDMIVYSPTNTSARDFSIRRIDRLHRHSKKVGAKLLKNRDADNKFDKHYDNGMLLTLGWPTVDQLSGKPVPRVALTDYDRMDDDIGGDGSAYDLAAKRTTTFGSFKMALAESSPSKPIENTRWIASSPHEAPPAKGILSLYNRGDRRRWYWPCPHCSAYFEGRFTHLEWDDKNDPLASAETVRMICPTCGHRIMPDDRHEMQQWGMWVKDGEGVDAKGRRFGKGRRTSIASFWLNGVAAAFTTWKRLVETYLAAEAEYTSTGSEEALKKFFNNDLGEPYTPKAADSDRLPEHLRSRADSFPVLEGDDSDKDAIIRLAAAPKGEIRHLVPLVPAGVRFLVANVDVQKNMFVVQIHGICPGTPFDIITVDRFQIRKSKRMDPSGEREWVKPATYLEDWDLLIEQVMDRTYELADGSGRRMAIKITTCDSGGYAKGKGESTTTMAYNFYRRLMRDNLHGRFHLTKGDPSPGIPRARITFPDASKKDKFSGARGDVPVLMFNSNVLKDGLHGRLDCIEPGKGMVLFPDWLPDWWFQELCSEHRTPKGWEKAPHARNEGWDLLCYCIGVCVSQLLLAEGIDWANPPRWASEWDTNLMVSQPGEAKRFAQPADDEYDFGSFARAIA